MECSGRWCLCLAVLVVVTSNAWAQTEGWLWTPPEEDTASGLQLPQDSPLSDSTPSRRPQRSRWPQKPQWPQRMAPAQPPRRPQQPKVPLHTQGPHYPQTQGHQLLKPQDSQESDYSLESEVYQVSQRPKFPQQPQAQQPQQSQPQWPQRTQEPQQPLWPQQQLPQQPQQPQQPLRPQQQLPQQPQQPPQQQLPQQPPQQQLPQQPQQPQRPQQQLPLQPQQLQRPQQQLPLQPQQLPQQPQNPQQPMWPQQQLPLRPHHPQQPQWQQLPLWPQQPQQPQLPPWPQQPQQPQRPQQFQQQLTQWPQLPERPQIPMWNQNSLYPHELEWDDPSTNMLQDSPDKSKCAVDENTKVTCGLPNITVEKCQTIDCCHDGRKCYYGKAVTVQCTKDGQFVLVIARDSIMPSLDLNSLSLLGGKDAPCSPVAANSAFAVFQFPVTECGTTMTEDDGFVIYENNMLSMYNVAIGTRGAITRDSHFELLFQCRYSGSSVEAVVVEVLPVPPPASITAVGTLRVQLRLANGHCLTKGCSMEKEAFTSFYSEADYPVTKVLREPVYVEVNIQDSNDPSLVLMLDHCWVTASPSDVSLPQWDLLYNGCPYQDDRYLTTLVPVAASPDLKYPSHHKRFILQMFTFVDQNSLVPMKDTMFLHCSVSVCHSTVPGSCVQSCNRKRRAVPAKKKTESQMTLSSREIILQ